MKIKVNPGIGFQEIEVVINCSEEDAMVKNIVRALTTINAKIPCRKQGELFQISTNDIYYIDSVDRKTFLYTDSEVYETDKRLYELEESLKNLSFFRVSKSTILNLKRVQSLRPELGARLIATLENDEQIMISRQYAAVIKTTLEV